MNRWQLRSPLPLPDEILSMLSDSTRRCSARSDEDRPETSGAGALRPSIYLQPGQLYASAAPCGVATIVGSCVAVCLHDPAARVGGVNHYLLPRSLGSGDELRYGSSAIPRLVQEVLRLGARRARLEAQIFGGAHIVAISFPRGQHLGSQNVQIARQLLAHEGIRIVAEEVEGSCARKLVFCTDAGTVTLRRLG